jgi:hypothetical protein
MSDEEMKGNCDAPRVLKFVTPMLLLRRSTARFLPLKRHDGFETRDESRESLRYIAISVGTMMYFESVVPFYSYTRHTLSHMGRMNEQDGEELVAVKVLPVHEQIHASSPLPCRNTKYSSLF